MAHYLICIVMGYAIGAINPAFFIAKLHGMDIRKSGSKNAGASNTLILFGKLQGLLCALFDIAKAYFVIWLAQYVLGYCSVRLVVSFHPFVSA